MRCYFAGPLFTDAERAWNASMAASLRAALPALDVHLPQEFCAVHDQAKAEGGGTDFAAIFRDCRDRVADSDVMVAVIDGADPDSGTCWEMGYAHAKDIPIIGYRSDWRPGEDQGANCMLTRSCVRLARSGEELISALAAQLQSQAKSSASL